MLEIGGGNGEHLPYVRYVPSKKYISLDLVTPKSKIYTEMISVELLNKLKFVKGDSEELKYKNSTFGRFQTKFICSKCKSELNKL